MAKYRFIVAAILFVGSSAVAEAARHRTPRDAAARFLAQHSSLPAGTGDVVRNPNECGVALAEPIWGGRGGLLGYACASATNGG